jgi:large subunit ribosomal protein L17
MRSLARNLIRDTKIQTTLAKAKELRPYVEKVVTAAKHNTVASKRLINSQIQGVKETKKLIEEIAPKYAKRAGGYTRIIKMPTREQDGAPMALIEFV